MPELLDYASAPTPVGSPRDRRYLWLLQLGHYVWGGLLLALFGGFALLATCILPFHGFADEPGSRGLDVLLAGLAFGLLGTAAGGATVRSGRLIGRRMRRAFSLGWAWVCVALGLAVLAAVVTTTALGGRIWPGQAALAALLGSAFVLGVATLCILSRDSVRHVYDVYKHVVVPEGKKASRRATGGVAPRRAP